MYEVESGAFLMFDLWDEICGGDVNEIVGGEGEKKSDVEGERRAVRDDAADQESQR